VDNLDRSKDIEIGVEYLSIDFFVVQGAQKFVKMAIEIFSKIKVFY
jgi:hypothetical protein